MPPRSFSSRLSVAFGAAPTSDGGAPSAEDPGAGGGVRRASFWQGQGGATPKGSPSEVELGSTPTPTAARPGGRPGMPVRQRSLESLVSQTVEEDAEEVVPGKGYRYYGAAKKLPGVRDLFKKAR